MSRHRARMYLAPTAVLALITASGAVGVALGPLFTRPTVEFGPSATVVAAAGGQAGSVERMALQAPDPASGSRSAATPSSAGRDRSTTKPPLAFPSAPAPVAETSPPADDVVTTTEPEPEPTSSPEPSPWSEADEHASRCGRRSE